MLSIPIHKDISKYEQKIALGLTARTLTFSALALALGLAEGAYGWLVLGLSAVEAPMMPVIMGSTVGLWILGYWKPLGLRFETFASLWLRHTFGTQRLCYQSSVALGRAPRPEVGYAKDTHLRVAGLVREPKVQRHYERLRCRRGIELWEPGE